MQRNIALAVAGVLIIAAIIYLEQGKAGYSFAPGGGDPVVVASTTPHSTEYALNAGKYPPAKELVSPDGYINTGGKPLQLADLVGSKVVLLDFWTYSCINCQRTIPYLEAWYQKYKDYGFAVVGVHTPEFGFEKVLANVQAGVEKFGITYPVVLDSSYLTWGAYNNNYWPEEYLIDIDGLVREHNIGEGNYQETEENIQTLLGQRARTLGEDPSKIPSGFVTLDETIAAASPETYFDYKRNEFLANGAQNVAGAQTFVAPAFAAAAPNSLYLGGTWNIGEEYAENTTAGARVTYHYKAKDVYLVASSQEGSTITVLVDGKPISAGRGADVDAQGQVHVQEPRLYRLIEGESQEEHVIELIISEPGLDAYTFTFG